jgi:tRNA(Ile2) C34 agmatinyltransferase TiaS
MPGQVARCYEAEVEWVANCLSVLYLNGREPIIRPTAEMCPSCGGRIGEQDFRCDLCALAVALALEEQP